MFVNLPLYFSLLLFPPEIGRGHKGKGSFVRCFSSQDGPMVVAVLKNADMRRSAEDNWKRKLTKVGQCLAKASWATQSPIMGPQ